MKSVASSSWFAFLISLPALLTGDAPAQSLPPSETANTTPHVVLSPFEVKEDKDSGYAASNTLAGSRLNTELRNTPAAISVFTKQFLDDIGALNTVDMLHYSLNATRDFTDMTGLAAVQQADLALKMRGFTGASLGRDYFPTGVSLDAFNTDRIDFARGPNSILFGVGGPGGIVNTSTKRARLNRRETILQARIGSWDDYRATLDLTRPLGQQLAVRVNGLWQDRESWREFEYFKIKAAATAFTFQPWRNTQLRVEGEYADRRQTLAMPWPAADYITPWINAGRRISPNNTTVVPGAENFGSRAVIYDPASPQGPVAWLNTQRTLRTAGAPSNGSNALNITDFSLVPRSANLLGPGPTSNNWYAVANIFLEQRVGGLVFELAYNHAEDGRYIRFPVNWADLGVYADANALLPATALPNGAAPALAGQPNPNAGRMFVQSVPGTRDIKRDNDNYRATLAYDLDLTRRNPWFGRHRFASLASRADTYFMTDALTEVNIAPPGTAFYPADITAASNRIIRRTYLDFGSSDPAKRGLADPAAHPLVNVNGVTSGFRRVSDSSNLQRAITDSAMIAGQSAFWRDRVNITWGLRRDEQKIYGSGGFTRAPNGEFSLRTLNTFSTDFGGNTRTYGIVFHAAPWASLVYNNANNFVGQSEVDIVNVPLGPRRGRGEDYGVKLNLWSGRINATLSRFETREVNRTASDARFTTGVVPQVNAIYQALGPVGATVPSTARDSVHNDSEGYEIEVTANPSKQWRLTANFARIDILQSNSFPRLGAFLAANRARWTELGATPLVPPISGNGLNNNSRVRDALAIIEATYGGLLQAEGRVPRQHVRHAFNAFTSYTFAQENAWWKGITLGGGANYRSAPVVGYDATRNFAPVYGGEIVIFNAMAARNFRLAKKYNLRTQLNVDNVLGFDDLIITDKDNTGTYRYLFNPQVRKWSVTTTLSF